jgi:hypothetical protein
MSVWTSTMNIPSTGNSGEKNRKRPRLYILATAALLLSVVSFIGVGAIPQAQAILHVADDAAIEHADDTPRELTTVGPREHADDTPRELTTVGPRELAGDVPVDDAAREPEGLVGLP